MSETVSLDALASEILLQIFYYLHPLDLITLRSTCKRFRYVIDAWDHYLVAETDYLVTNQVHDMMKKRSQHSLFPLEKYRISENWVKGKCRDRSLLRTRNHKKYSPCLVLLKDFLWFSRGSSISCFRRAGCQLDLKKLHFNISAKDNIEITKFRLYETLVLYGHSEGIQIYSLEEHKHIFNIDVHNVGSPALDITNNIISFGGRNEVLKSYVRNPEGLWQQGNNWQIGDRIWSVAIQDRNVAAGIAAKNITASIFIFDMSNNAIVNRLPGEYGAGICDLKWESPNILWSCGYDSTVRKWDRRSEECVQAFQDPCQSTIYTFDYDYFNTILTGCGTDGKVVLWDTRQPKYIQMYFMNSCKRNGSSPVYSLSFDPEYLFTATDQNLNVLDFSTNNGVIRDYSNLFKFQIIV